MEPLKFFLITGLSGAGKSQALQAFEDMGYYCVDNLPVQLLDQFITLCKNQPEKRPVAFILDIRDKKFISDFAGIVKKFAQPGVKLEIIFLEATEPELLNRYRESRRLHPLSAEGGLEDAISFEKEQLIPVRSAADMVIDTTETNIHQFKRFLIDLCNPAGQNRFTLALLSFGFKYGSPSNLDYLFDVRFLPNPHYYDELRPFTGLDEEIGEFMKGFEETGQYLERLEKFIGYCADMYMKTDKTALFIGIGCTGGRHRSVYLVEKLKQLFTDKNINVVATHRDID
ncbi:MAG: RNase adapter RapZ [bacterium]